jgi:TonB family protein
MLFSRLLFTALLFLSPVVLLVGSAPAKPKVTPPIPVQRFAPRFPFEAKRAGVSGIAVVEFMVGKDGNVSDAVVVQATRKDFGDAAVKCILEWKFRPGKVDGRVTEFKLRQEFPFDLGNVPVNRPQSGAAGNASSASTAPNGGRP